MSMYDYKYVGLALSVKESDILRYMNVLIIPFFTIYMNKYSVLG
jgi:hypothetical protein